MTEGKTMSETKWTPGPWEVSRQRPDYVMADRHALTIAMCGKSAVLSTDAMIANARLIAAAPDLVTALTAIMAWDAARIAAGASALPIEIADEARAALTKAGARETT